MPVANKNNRKNITKIEAVSATFDTASFGIVMCVVLLCYYDLQL